MNDVVDMGAAPEQRRQLATAPATPADIVLYAMQHGADIAQIEKFMDLQMKWEADQARKAYVADMAEFKKNPPEIVKDKQVAFNGTSYMHATLGAVTEAIVTGIARHGFSHRWDTQQANGIIEVSCIITHRLGHSERTTLTGAKDDSGKKNQIQQVASTITYLQRYTLLAATGVATKDMADDDGRAAELDTTLADKWLGEVRDADNRATLEAVWSLGKAELHNAKDVRGFNEVKEAVRAKLATFPPADAPA